MIEFIGLYVYRSGGMLAEVLKSLEHLLHMKTRSYEPTDYSQLEQLLKATGLYDKLPDSQHAVNKKAEIDKNTIMVAEDNGEIVGCVFFSYEPTESIIYHLGVLPQHQNRGVGTLLLECAEQELKRRGTKRLLSLVFTENKTSLGFFSEKGWKRIGNLCCFEKRL